MHVTLRLSSARLQRTSKCGMFLQHFDIFCDLLLYRHKLTWNISLICNKKRNKNMLTMSSIRMSFDREHKKEPLKIRDQVFISNVFLARTRHDDCGQARLPWPNLKLYTCSNGGDRVTHGHCTRLAQS